MRGRRECFGIGREPRDRGRVSQLRTASCSALTRAADPANGEIATCTLTRLGAEACHALLCPQSRGLGRRAAAGTHGDCGRVQAGFFLGGGRTRALSWHFHCTHLVTFDQSLGRTVLVRTLRTLGHGWKRLHGMGRCRNSAKVAGFRGCVCRPG